MTANDLLEKVSKEEATKMLNYAYNTSKSEVFKKALNHIESL